MVSPFVTADGVERLLGSDTPCSELRVVCRWSEYDIASGLADLGIYPVLRDMGVRLYRHPRIHLKLYVFGNGSAFHSSANATGKGLGAGSGANIEVGASTLLCAHDWDQLYDLINASVAVDDSVYREALTYKEVHAKEPGTPLPELVLSPALEATHSISSLPVSPSPEVFARWHSDPDKVPAHDTALYQHDRTLFGVPPEASGSACIDLLARRFKAHPFIKEIVSLIQEAGAVPFGRVKEWLQENCSDRPVPYRWELTKNTQVLYQWLSFFYDEITWDRPRHSMVIRWTQDGKSAAPAELSARSGVEFERRRSGKRLRHRRR